MVSYRGSDGKQAYHQAEDLNDAIHFVEHLRNDESVDHARIYKMEELSFEYRPYYRVELATAAAPAPAPAPAVKEAVKEDESPWLASQEAAAAAVETADDDVDPLAAAWAAGEPRQDPPVGAGMGRKGLFGR